jgi:hypothetical protein
LALLSKVELHVQSIGKSLVLFLHGQAKACNCVSSVVLDAVVKGKLNVVEEFLETLVSVLGELLADGVKVHWVLDDVEIIRDFKFNRIDWLLEDPALRQFPQHVKHLACQFFPRFVQKCVLLDLRSLQLLQLLLVH